MEREKFARHSIDVYSMTILFVDLVGIGRNSTRSLGIGRMGIARTEIFSSLNSSECYINFYFVSLLLVIGV